MIGPQIIGFNRANLSLSADFSSVQVLESASDELLVQTSCFFYFYMILYETKLHVLLEILYLNKYNTVHFLFFSVPALLLLFHALV